MRSSLVLYACFAAFVSGATAEDAFGPPTGEKVPPLETVIDESTKEICARNMGVD